MHVAGKYPPESEALAKAAENGFDKVELYLEKQHLDPVDTTVAIVEEAPVNVVSVHTPHVTLDELSCMKKADELTDAVDAFLVVHSQYLHHVHIPDLEDLSFTARYGYENNPGISAHHLEQTILEPGHRLVFDTAHFYMAHGDDYSRMRELLDAYGGQIPVVHFNDATSQTDGLPVGDGDMDMAAVADILAESQFDGVVVMEVMPEHQKAACDRFTSTVF